MHRVVLAHAGLVLAAAISSGGALAQESHDHAHGAAPSPGAAITSGSELYSPDDLYFIHHMIMHHQQALEMSALMNGRSQRPELLRFAKVLADAQASEIRLMQSMLEMAQSRGLPIPHHEMSGDPPMAGMLSSAEMRSLAAARGVAFERLWLKGMIFHHEGALAMARALELRQALDARQPDSLSVFIDDLLLEQRAEISIMTRWLREWGLATGGDERAPAVEVTSPPPGTVLPVSRPTTLFGVAADDAGVAAVRLAVHDLSRDDWLRHDGGWGERQFHLAQRVASGSASAAWSFVFTPPERGRFSVTVEAEDKAGKRAEISEPAVFEAQ